MQGVAEDELHKLGSTSIHDQTSPDEFRRMSKSARLRALRNFGKRTTSLRQLKDYIQHDSYHNDRQAERQLRTLDYELDFERKFKELDVESAQDAGALADSSKNKSSGGGSDADFDEEGEEGEGEQDEGEFTSTVSAPEPEVVVRGEGLDALASIAVGNQYRSSSPRSEAATDEGQSPDSSRPGPKRYKVRGRGSASTRSRHDREGDEKPQAHYHYASASGEPQSQAGSASASGSASADTSFSPPSTPSSSPTPPNDESDPSWMAEFKKGGDVIREISSLNIGVGDQP